MLHKGDRGYEEFVAVAKNAQQQILARFELGMAAASILQTSENPDGDLKNIAKTASVSIKEVRLAVAFAEWMKTETAVEALLNRRGPYGAFITWPVILVLLKTNDMKFRAGFLEKFFERGMKAKALANEMFPRPRHKRTMSVPRTLTGAVTNVCGLAQRFEKRLDNAFVAQLEMIRELPEDHPKRERILENVDDLINLLDRVIPKAIRLRSELHQIVQRMCSANQTPSSKSA